MLERCSSVVTSNASATAWGCLARFCGRPARASEPRCASAPSGSCRAARRFRPPAVATGGVLCGSSEHSSNLVCLFSAGIASSRLFSASILQQADGNALVVTLPCCATDTLTLLQKQAPLTRTSFIQQHKAAVSHPRRASCLRSCTLQYASGLAAALHALRRKANVASRRHRRIHLKRRAARAKTKRCRRASKARSAACYWQASPS